MNYINKTMLIGRAGNDPEIKYFESGSVKAKVSIAVKPPYKSDQPLWFDLVFWGATAEVVGNYVRKGTQVAVTGEFGFDRWVDSVSGMSRVKPIINVTSLELISPPRTEADNLGQHF